MKKEITIKDIAKKANVSVSTVSRVLNDKGRVSKNTKNRTLKIIEQMNYVQNSFAVSMVKKRSNMIVVMVPDIFTTFYAEVIHGVEEIAKKNGISTLVFTTNDLLEQEKIFLNGGLLKVCDGVVAIPGNNNPEIYKNFEKPIIFVDRYIKNTDINGVVIDNFDGTYKLTKNLINNGHDKIAIIMGDKSLNIGGERLWGYQQALIDNGISIHDEYCFMGSWYEDNGYISVEKITKMKNPPTAILAANSNISIGAIKYFNDNELEIGKDYSFVGFDENILTEFIKPKMTIIKRPTLEMGRIAVEILIDMINKGKNSRNAQIIKLAVHLIEGSSVKNLHDSM